MAFQLTFADVPFRLPDRATIEHCERFGLLDMPDVEPTTDVGRSGLMLAQPIPQPYRPKLGEFWFPTGMSRCAIFQGLMTGVDVQKAIAVTNADDGYAQFVMQNDGLNPNSTGFTYGMYLLPPRPLALVDSDAAGGLWLVTLVDDRWRVRFQSAPYTITGFVATCSALTSTDTWSSPSTGGLLGWFSDNLYISTVNLPTPAAAYGQPEPDSPLYGFGERACTVLDAICANIGGFINPVFPVVPDSDPYAFTTWRQALANTAAARLASKDRIAGGAVFNPTQTIVDSHRPLLLPNNFEIAFPKWISGVGYYQPENYRDFYRRGNSYGDVFKLEIATSSLGSPYSSNSFGNFGAYWFIETTAKALYADYSTVPDGVGANPTNYSAVLALATQLCKDFCDRELASLDEIYQGIQPWPSNTGHDVLYVWNTDTCFTRVRRQPYGLAPRSFQHGFGPLAPSIPYQMFAGTATVVNPGSSPGPTVDFVNVTFTGPMPSTNYAVTITPLASNTIAWWVTSQTVTGFTIQMASAPGGSSPGSLAFDWIAVTNT
jgi:hypothetical protein